MAVNVDRNAGTITLDQGKYVEDLLVRFGYQEVKKRTNAAMGANPNPDDEISEEQ